MHIQVSENLLIEKKNLNIRIIKFTYINDKYQSRTIVLYAYAQLSTILVRSEAIPFSNYIIQTT